MNELQITELNGQRVLTTQQIAEGYGTDSASITKTLIITNLDLKKGNISFYYKVLI